MLSSVKVGLNIRLLSVQKTKVYTNVLLKFLNLANGKHIYRRKTFLRPTLWLCLWVSSIILRKLACWWNSCRIEMCLLMFLKRICHRALSLFFHNKSAVFSLIRRIFSSSRLAFISICMSERVVLVKRRYKYSFLRVFVGSKVAFIIGSSS